MPVLTSLSLLSTTVSGVLQAAGQVADVLDSVKSGSLKKTDSSKQTPDAGQLANLFAAYLAAAAQTTTDQVVSQAPSSNVPQNGAIKSAKDVSASLAPLSVVLALGPTTAITASLALHSAPAGGTASSKTAQTPALAQGATPKVSTAANALPAPGKQASATVTKTLSPPAGSQAVRTTSISDRKAIAPSQGTQSVLSVGRAIAETTTARVTPLAQGTLPASGQVTKTEVPVLALHDVPVPVSQDNSQPAVVVKESVNGTRTSFPSGSSPQPSAAVAHRHVEILPEAAASPIIAAAQTKFIGGMESSRPTSGGKVALEDSTHSTITTNSANNVSQPQTVAPQSAMNTIVTTAAPVGQTSANTIAPGSNHPQTIGTVAEQLSHAFVTHASVADHEGRTDFHLRLEPPHLGSVQIHLTAMHDKVSARVIVAQEETRQLIVGQAHQLRQSLAESGLVLGSFDVTHDGGGFPQGGNRQPPEPPQPQVMSRATPSVSTVAKTSPSVPTDGIDILA